MEIVLASASPRRRELLSLITEHFTVCPADADETLRDAPLGEEVTRLSRLKAEAVQVSWSQAIRLSSWCRLGFCFRTTIILYSS